MNNSNNFKQPEALRLADLLDENWEYHSDLQTQAAAELRRLYAEVDRLSYQLAYPDNFVKETEQELLEALNAAEALLHSMGMQSSDAYQEIDAAIAKATQEGKCETY